MNAMLQNSGTTEEEGAGRQYELEEDRTKKGLDHYTHEFTAVRKDLHTINQVEAGRGLEAPPLTEDLLTADGF